MARQAYRIDRRNKHFRMLFHNAILTLYRTIFILVLCIVRFDTLLLINEYSETTQPVEHMYEDFGSFVDYHAVYGDSLGITIGFLLLEYVLEVGRGPTLTNRPRCAMVSSSDNLEIVMHVLQQVQLFVISVMYFLLVMILCVLSLASTVLVMHTCSDRYPLRPMPDWVCCLLPTYITRTGWLKIVSHYQESPT